MNGLSACDGRFTYDAENRITSTAGVTYSYDGDGQRVKKSTGTLYYYIPGTSSILQESDLAGNTRYRYVFFNGKRIMRRNSSSGAIQHYFSDHLGTSRVVTNATGSLLDDSDFYPFGGERAVLSSSGNNYKFTGKERDAESGLDYFGARHMGSSIGRFLSPDPDQESGLLNPDDPQSWNGYEYARNNPLMFGDPSGREYQVCQANGVKAFNCAEHVSDADFKKLQNSKDLTFRNGIIFSSGNAIGTYANKGPDMSAIGQLVLHNPIWSPTARVVNRYIAAPLLTFLSLAVPGVLKSSPVTNPSIGILGQSLKVQVNAAHAFRAGHVSVAADRATAAVESAVQSGKYTNVLEGSNQLIRGEVVVDGVSVAFKGKIVDGVARVNIYDKIP